MAAKNAQRGIKRFLEESTADKVDQGKIECRHVRSKKLKRRFCAGISRGANECQNESQFTRDCENSAEEIGGGSNGCRSEMELRDGDENVTRGINEDLFIVGDDGYETPATVEV